VPGKAVLIAAVVATLCSIGIDLLGLALWKGYDYVHQSITQLSALGAPTRPWAVALTIGRDLALLIVGLTLWLVSDRNVALRITASLVITTAAAGFAAEFFPTQVGQSPPFSSPSVILGAIAVVASVLVIAFGAAAFSGWFRAVSIGVLAAFALLTILGFMQTSPRIGLQERVMSYAILAWVILLGVALTTERGGQSTAG
jgi:hypothetical protein